MFRRVRPASGAAASATVSSTRTVVVPTATTRRPPRARSSQQRADRAGRSRTPPSASRARRGRRLTTGRNVSRPIAQVDLDDRAALAHGREQLGREVQAGGRGGRRARRPRVDGLVALRVGRPLAGCTAAAASPPRRAARPRACPAAIGPHQPAARLEPLDDLDLEPAGRHQADARAPACAPAAPAPPRRRRRAARSAAPRPLPPVGRRGMHAGPAARAWR